LILASADSLVVLMKGDLERVLFDEPAIHRRLDDIAGQISNDYRERELTVIAVLHGSLMFVADLLRRIPLPLKLDCLSVASYHGEAQSSGNVVFKEITAPDVAGRDVLILDDILDSGHTLAAIRETLETAKPNSIRICVLLSKKKQRAREVDTDYVGFEIEDEFVVGYGLDFRERYRNLPYIGVLRKELLEQSRK
jgi:hypoxanthine phosphoribosyltransferase